jgi:MraZ protein
MLLGRTQLTLDDKHRIVLPAAFRDSLQGNLFFALGDENQVGIWPEAAFQEKLAIKKARELQGGADGRREFLRFTSNASQVKMDAQFRVPVPETLRTLARLDRSRPVAMVGASDRVELWDSNSLDGYLNGPDDLIAASVPAPTSGSAG